VTFHDKAKYQPLHFLQQLPKGKQPLPLRFVSKNPGKGKYTIRMPENTPFRVVFKAGPRFEILDKDARDGQAVVQMPSELREGYTRVRSPRSKELLRSLTLKDPLYKLTQELVRNDEGPGSFLLTANPPRTEPSRSAKPTPAPKLKPLQLSSVCSDEPEEYRLWKIENPNNQPVPYGWEVEGSPQSGNEVAPPGESYFESETENGNNKVTLTVEGKKEINRVSLPTQCRDGEEPGVSIWWKLGVRPFPIPASWNAGSDYTLEFQPQNIPAFTLRWIKSQASTPDFPPGLAEIGPAGGNVDLPGVAKLAVPAGAVNQKTLFRISQVSQAMGLQTQCESRILAQESCLPGFDFASALVKLEPFKLQLNTPASLTLAIDSARLGNNHPGTLRYKANQTNGLDPESWAFDPLLAPAPGSALSATTQTALPVKTLAHVAAFMPVLVQPQDGFVPVQSGSLLLTEKESHVSNADAQALLNQLSGALGYYSSLGLPSPVGGQHEWQSGPVLPVTVMKAGALAGVSEVFGRSLVAGPPEKEQISPSSKFLGSKIVLRQCSESGEHCGGYAAQETVAQDAFHLVQQSYYRDATGQNGHLNYGKYQQYLGWQIFSQEDNLFQNFEDRSFYQSAATVMGAYYAHKVLQLSPTQDSPYFAHLQKSQERLDKSLMLSNNYETQHAATGFLSHLILNDPTGPQTLAAISLKLKAALETGLEPESRWSPSLKALTQGLNLSERFGSYAQAAWTREKLSLLPGMAVKAPIQAGELTLRKFNSQKRPIETLAKAYDLAIEYLILSPDNSPINPVKDKTIQFGFISDSDEPNTVLSPSSIEGALPGSSFASQDFTTVRYMTLKRQPDGAETTVQAFTDLKAQPIRIEHFGGDEAPVNQIVLFFANGLGQRKAFEEAEVSAELQFYYESKESQEQWKAPLPENFSVGEASPLLQNGLLYLVGPSGQIIAQKAETGQIEWQRSLPTPLSATPALGSDGSLYLGGVNGTFYAFNPDGSTRWSFTPEEPNSFRLGGVALDKNGILYTGGTAEAVYALNSQTGQEVWRFQARAPIDSAPIVSEDRVYVLALDQTLYALDRASGEYLWEFQTGQPISDITPALTPKGDIIFGSSDNWLYSVNRQGIENWSYVMQGGLSASPVVDQNGTVYAPSSDGKLYAVDTSGRLLWSYDSGAQIQAAPVLGDDTLLYLGTSQGKVIALSVWSDKHVEIEWEKSVNGAVRGRLLMDNNGVLYGITDQGQSFAFHSGSDAPRQNAWPMEHGNLQGWGRAK